MSLRDGIDNYYERLVVDELDKQRQGGESEGFLQDVLCVALNNLPPRYFRHSIDMMFYLSGAEMEEMMGRVRSAVSKAYQFVADHRRDESQP